MLSIDGEAAHARQTLHELANRCVVRLSHPNVLTLVASQHASLLFDHARNVNPNLGLKIDPGCIIHVEDIRYLLAVRQTGLHQRNATWDPAILCDLAGDAMIGQVIVGGVNEHDLRIGAADRV